MILGNGCIANAIKNSNYFSANDDIIIYAKGVSNFNETSSKQFIREELEILELSKIHKNKKLIYFSSQSVMSNYFNPYIKHKLHIEALISNNLFKKYLILRLPNIIGQNKKTLFYNIYKNISENNTILIDYSITKEFLLPEEIPEFLKILIEFENTVINVGFNRNISIKSIVETFSNQLRKQPNIKEFNFKYNYKCDYTFFLNLIKNIYNYNFNLDIIIAKFIKNNL